MLVTNIVPLLYDEQLQCASFDVYLHPDIPKTTHALDVNTLFECYPDLRRHRCLCGKHRSFYDEARQTETVHLLEHLAVELLTLSGVARDVARGETGIPTKKGDYRYRLRFYGAESLQQMGKLLYQAIEDIENLVISQKND